MFWIKYHTGYTTITFKSNCSIAGSRYIVEGMKQGQYKTRLQMIIYSRPFLVVFFLLIIIFLVKVFELYQKDRIVTKEKNTVMNEAQALQAKAESLRTDIESLSTERGIEQAIRDKFRVVKEGESIVVIPDQNSASSRKANEQYIEEQQYSSGFKQFLKEWFGIQ